MNKTNIEWAKNPDGSQGYTWNPITGCLNHIDGLCKGGGFPCYAYRLANTRLKDRYLVNRDIAPTPNYPYRDPIIDSMNIVYGWKQAYSDPFYPRFWSGRLDEKFGEWGDGKGIFVCDMADLFGIGVPEKWTWDVLEKIDRLGYEHHRFYLLTKQPQNLHRFSPFPRNCYVGVTVCNQSMHNEAIACMAGIKAKIKYISYEPLLRPISATHAYDLSEIQWVILGSQTKPTVMPKIEWVEEIVKAADRAGAKVFLKNNLKGYDLSFQVHGLRQEMPDHYQGK